MKKSSVSLSVNSKNILIYAVSVMSAVLFCAAVWAIIGIYPGSYRTLLNSDMESQYVSFFESLRSIINGKNSMFYNWSTYLGNNFLGHYAYYLASPWSWFILLWKTENMPIAIYFMSIIKIGLCALTFSVFLINRPIRFFNVNAHKALLDSKIYNAGVIAFSVIYALMSYNMIYIFCPMWIDTVYMLPLIILGLERLMIGKNSVLYYVSFLLTIIFNFYTAYMVALFTVIYYVYYACYCRSLAYNWEDDIKVNIKFNSFIKYVLSSLAAAGTSLFLLLPTVYCLMQGKIEHDTNYFFRTFTYPLWQILFRFFDSSYTSVTNEGLPSVFCTSFCVIFTVLFVVKGLKKSSRISAIAIILFWIASLWIVSLNRMWTGFRDPIWFPFRYTFLISFFFVLLGFEGYITFATFKFKYKKYVYIIWALLSVFELYLCVNNPRIGIIREIGSANTTLWNDALMKYGPLVDYAKTTESDIDNENSTGFFRMDKPIFFTFNDSMLFDYNGIQSFTSLFNEETLLFMKKMGYKQDDYELYEQGNSIITDSILDVKYLMTMAEIDEFYEKAENNRLVNLYRNPYALSLGYMIEDRSIEELGDNAFENQNLILSSMVGKRTEAYYLLDYDADIITYDEIKKTISKNSTRPTELKYSKAENRKLTLSASEDGHVYLYTVFEPGHLDEIEKIYANFKQFYLNKEYYDSIQYGCYNYIMDLGYFRQGEEIEVIITNCTEGTQVYFAGMNNDVVLDALNLLNDNAQFRDIKISKGNMTAQIDANEAGIVFMSIPYDDGWTLWVDGQKTDINPAFGTFCSFDVMSGSHIIEMKYVSPMFKEGTIASVIFMFAYLLSNILLAYNIRRKKNDSDQRLNQ